MKQKAAAVVKAERKKQIEEVARTREREIRYLQRNTRGARLPGWEDLNVEALSKDAKLCPQHVRQLLTGRSAGRVKALEDLSRLLQLTVGDLYERIQTSKRLDKERRKEVAQRWQSWLQ